MRRGCAALSALCIGWLAVASAAASTRQAPTTDVVKPGQTLYKIAQKHGVTLAELCRANDLECSKPIQPGRKLVIPSRAAPGKTDADPSETPTRSPARANTAGRSDEPMAAASKAPNAVVEAQARPVLEDVKHKRRPARARLDGARAGGKASSEAHDDDEVGKLARPAKRPGYLIVHSTVGEWQGLARTRKGRIPETARQGLARVLASWRTGEQQPIADELILLLTRVSDHFGGRPIRVVSGFRPWSPSQHTPHSQHNLGRAVDFSIPGVPNTIVRDYCRKFAKAGVGFYPNSSFVHLDARGYPSYWVDHSGPGERPRYANARPDPRAEETRDREREPSKPKHDPESTSLSKALEDSALRAVEATSAAAVELPQVEEDPLGSLQTRTRRRRSSNEEPSFAPDP
jgi:uncharacterized protein YcbK (DUF882 family)